MHHITLMQNLIPDIFLSSLFGVLTFFILISFLGAVIARLAPKDLEYSITSFLSPAIGLSALIIFSCYQGRYSPIHVTPILYLLLMMVIIYELFKRKESVVKFIFLMGFFGLLSGVSFFAPLFLFGGFSTHNDAFTYITHSDWLQLNTFSVSLDRDSVNPLASQIFLYQMHGLRMGGSFLLAFIQSLYRFEWGYSAYPILTISALGSSCLALGLPLFDEAIKNRKAYQFLLLLLPAFSMGGVVFAANIGFMPQILGVGIGAAGIFLTGYVIKFLLLNQTSIYSIIRLSFLTALLYSASIFSYTEFSPFILVANFITAVIIFCKFRFSKYQVFSYLFFSFLGTFFILNIEVSRAVSALAVQSSALVGTPVAWPWYGYLSHALGIHGGAWDAWQWSMHSGLEYAFGVSFLIFLLSVIFFHRKTVYSKITDGSFLTSFVMLCILFFGFLYFRYVVESPQDGFQGQSWSQFKISDWAQPFATLFILLALLQARSRFSQYFDLILYICTLIVVPYSIWWGIQRTRPIMEDYQNTKNQMALMLNFREKVSEICPKDANIYLNMEDSKQKIRQLAIYFLPDRNLKSNWMTDGYIYNWLSEANKITYPSLGDCVISVEKSNKQPLFGSFKLGPFYIRKLEYGDLDRLKLK